MSGSTAARCSLGALRPSLRKTSDRYELPSDHASIDPARRCPASMRDAPTDVAVSLATNSARTDDGGYRSNMFFQPSVCGVPSRLTFRLSRAPQRYDRMRLQARRLQADDP